MTSNTAETGAWFGTEALPPDSLGGRTVGQTETRALPGCSPVKLQA